MKPFLLCCTFLISLSIFWLSSCSQGDQSARNPSHSTQKPAAVATGVALFNQNCKLCHGADGRLGLNGAKDLSQSILTFDERVNIITNGKNLMTPFGKLLSKTEIDSLAFYTIRLKHQNPQ